MNGIGRRRRKAVTRTTPAPNWSFTLRDASNNDVTELTEGGDAATATVSITNNVRFSADQTVTIEWWGFDLGTSRADRGRRERTTITIPAERDQREAWKSTSRRTLNNQYQPSLTRALTAVRMAGRRDRRASTSPTSTTIQRCRWRASRKRRPTVDEGDTIEVEITLTPTVR